MKKTIIFLIIVLCSCDDKIKTLDKLNVSPDVYYFSHHATSWKKINENNIIKDTMKTYNFINNLIYRAGLKIKDYNNNYASITLSSIDPVTQFWINDEYYYSTIQVELDSFSFAYKNQEVGKKIISFNAIDDFGKEINFDFEINFMENKPPVAMLETNLLNDFEENEYILDASKSYDRDHKIGGFIKQYQFVINDQIINTSSNYIKHVFTENTSYILKLRVQDNDDVWSQTIIKNLIVP